MGIFGWLKPEEEPEDSSLVEISNDRGDHIVVNTPTHDDALDVEGQARRELGAKVDKDEKLGARGQFEYQIRDDDEYRVRSARVVDSNEDLEREEDDDSMTEQNEQSASNGWWPFG